MWVDCWFKMENVIIIHENEHSGLGRLVLKLDVKFIRFFIYLFFLKYLYCDL